MSEFVEDFLVVIIEFFILLLIVSLVLSGIMCGFEKIINYHDFRASKRIVYDIRNTGEVIESGEVFNVIKRLKDEGHYIMVKIHDEEIPKKLNEIEIRIPERDWIHLDKGDIVKIVYDRNSEGTVLNPRFEEILDINKPKEELECIKKLEKEEKERKEYERLKVKFEKKEEEEKERKKYEGLKNKFEE